MKTFSFYLLLFFMFSINILVKSQVSIVIHDNQNNCNNYTDYYLTKDSLIIDELSEHDDASSYYIPPVLYRKALSDDQQQRLTDFCDAFPLDSLSKQYASGKKKKCDEQRVIKAEIKMGKRSKQIQITDYYQKNMAD